MDKVIVTLWLERLLFLGAMVSSGMMVAGFIRPEKALWWSRVKTYERVALVYGVASLALFATLFAVQLSFAFVRGDF